MRINTNVSSRNAFALLAVLVVVVLLTLAAYEFSELMLEEYRACDSYARLAQAKAAADSGVNYAAMVLGNSTAFSTVLNSQPFNNQGAFQGISVNSQAPSRLQGRFTILTPLDPTDPNYGTQTFRYGVSDESAKINLNALMKLDSSGTVAHNMLMTLPNMTEDIANSILDWIDADDEARPNGAESDYYSSLTPPYACKNGPLDSIEELLLVKGVTPQLLLGNDQNRNGALDPEEDDGSGTLDRGWAANLTVYSREMNVDSSGNPRIDVNGRDLNNLSQQLTSVLGPDLANFIVAYRLYGPATGGSSSRVAGPAGGASGTVAFTADGSRVISPNRGGPTAAPVVSRGAAGGAAAAGSGSRGGTASNPSLRLSQTQMNTGAGRGSTPRTISSLFELIGTSVSIPGDTPQSQPTIYPSPLNDQGNQSQLLPLLLDSCTTVNATEIPARINVNTASQTVLAALPGLSSADVQNIITHRPDSLSTDPPDPIYQTPAWLLTQANIPPAVLRTLDRYITTRTQVYRVQAIGYLDAGGPMKRIEAVIDANQGLPRIVYYRDLSELGVGYARDAIAASPASP
jgi:type II secretory pathway component PulK